MKRKFSIQMILDDNYLYKNLTRIIKSTNDLAESYKKNEKSGINTFTDILPLNHKLPYLVYDNKYKNEKLIKQFEYSMQSHKLFSKRENFFDIILVRSIYLLYVYDWIDPQSKFIERVLRAEKPLEKIALFSGIGKIDNMIRFLLLEFKIYFFIENALLPFDYFVKLCKLQSLPQIVCEKNAIFMYKIFCCVNNWVDIKRILFHHGVPFFKIKTGFNPHLTVSQLESRQTIYPKETSILRWCILVLNILLKHPLACYTPYILEMIKLFPIYFDVEKDPTRFHPESLYLTGFRQKKIDNVKTMKFIWLLMSFKGIHCPFLRFKVENYQEDKVPLEVIESDDEKLYFFLCFTFKNSPVLFHQLLADENIASNFNLKFVPKKKIVEKHIIAFLIFNKWTTMSKINNFFYLKKSLNVFYKKTFLF